MATNTLQTPVTPTVTACPICVEKFTLVSKRKPIVCHLCEHKACVGCCETYLLGSIQDAHCMSCRRIWSKEFMITSFPVTFINQTYKKHREDILMARQKAILPQRMVKIDRINRGKELAESIKPLSAEIEEKRNVLRILEETYYRQMNRVASLYEGVDPDARGLKVKESIVREFHKPCPANDCRGFLSTQYKCGLCLIWSCPDCYEIKGLDKDAAHVCKPENVESVKLKKKQCKNCPECGAEIYKEIGCDQMWCTMCQTTFDWKTGSKLVNVKVHNPHYYEFLRRTQGSVPRDADDRNIQCYEHREIYMSIIRIGNRTHTMSSRVKRLVTDCLMEFIRIITHIEHVEVPRHTIVEDISTNEDIDLQYLRKYITEKSWKQMLQNREKQRIKKENILQVLQMIIQAGKDILVAFVNRYVLDVQKKEEEAELLKNIIKDVWNQIEGLRTIANESFEKHARLYKCQAPRINLLPNTKKEYVLWEFNLRYNYINPPVVPPVPDPETPETLEV